MSHGRAAWLWSLSPPKPQFQRGPSQLPAGLGFFPFGAEGTPTRSLLPNPLCSCTLRSAGAAGLAVEALQAVRELLALPWCQAGGKGGCSSPAHVP